MLMHIVLQVIRAKGRMTRRHRRRGPRSYESLLRRSCAHSKMSCRQPQDGGLCESKPVPPWSSFCLTILNLNVRGFLSHKTELEAHLELLCYPLLVGMTETFLTSSTLHPTLHNYTLISRLDRRDGRNAGGVILFGRDDIASQIVHFRDSDQHERVWYVLHTDSGLLFIGLWYRPPQRGEIASIHSLRDELTALSDNSIGLVLFGDMNVHETSWLEHSSSTTLEGRELFKVCCSFGLTECVCAPTRGQYLLDLFLTNLSHAVSTEVHAGVSDRSMVLVRL